MFSLKWHQSQRALNTETAVHFCILETAGKQSLKNANVYEKLNALEHGAQICNRVSLVILHEQAKTTRKLLPLELHTTDGVESNTAQRNVFLNNVVNIAVKRWVCRTGFCRQQLSPPLPPFPFPPVRSVNSFIPDIRSCRKILKETNRVKWGLCLYPWLQSVLFVCVWAVGGGGGVIGASERLKPSVTSESKTYVNHPSHSSVSPVS